MSIPRHAFEEAVALRERTRERFEAFLESEGKDAIAEKNIVNSVRPGLYEHWKSKEGDPKYYVVHGAGCEQDVYTPLVAYAALNGPHAGHLTFRHLLDEHRGFLTPVQHATYVGPRFKLVSKLSWKEIDILLQYVGELMVIMSPIGFRVRCHTLLKKTIL